MSANVFLSLTFTGWVTILKPRNVTLLVLHSLLIFQGVGGLSLVFRVWVTILRPKKVALLLTFVSIPAKL